MPRENAADYGSTLELLPEWYVLVAKCGKCRHQGQVDRRLVASTCGWGIRLRPLVKRSNARAAETGKEANCFLASCPATKARRDRSGSLLLPYVPDIALIANRCALLRDTLGATTRIPSGGNPLLAAQRRPAL
ncbi:hypothetical protein MZK49_15460 [Ensifer sesbaniae]|jgi:hypothetical protein|uniref:hypothetical protein n=1 Tax=Ensifer sesbaniae TaxID=1214071 RepID=UPI0015697DA9|nr:hypothetical protein [Ensifer sesbaniae]MCK3778105.1 hypothetical protein [Ensifer sesbaniae]